MKAYEEICQYIAFGPRKYEGICEKYEERSQKYEEIYRKYEGICRNIKEI